MEVRPDEAMLAAVEQARINMKAQFGGPFGATIIKDGQIISVAANSVLRDHDPSAHAEINAIRKAGEILGTHDLSGCVLYATGYPCPMCLAAIIWANIDTVYYGCEAWEAEEIGFRDDFIYRFIENKRSDGSVLKLMQLEHDSCRALYDSYRKESGKLY
ncbi:nucleoside deaminase [Pleomorphochaeta sp. DL1XJH-081]|uniref:nucleoside deaminase n=1 Tax=Pleomorphochaeta sp. DL1XJH-081 TaxID=3409690 RepID=UPI003BB56958